jgi:hypothetical protein
VRGTTPHRIRIPPATSNPTHRPVVTPGRIEVEDLVVEEMRAHPVAAAWFGPDKLVVTTTV